MWCKVVKGDLRPVVNGRRHGERLKAGDVVDLLPAAAFPLISAGCVVPLTNHDEDAREYRCA